MFLCSFWVLVSNRLGPWFPCLPLSSRVYIADSDFPPETENLDSEDWSRKDFVWEMLPVPLALSSLFLHFVSFCAEGCLWVTYLGVEDWELICAFLPNNRKLEDTALGSGGVGNASMCCGPLCHVWGLSGLGPSLLKERMQAKGETRRLSLGFLVVPWA